MKKLVTLTLAAAMSAASVGTVALAQTTSSTTPMMQEEMVRVVEITADSDSDEGNNQIPEAYRNPTNDMMMKAQAEIQADAALMAALQSKNVELENVVAIETAANGGKVVYVK